MGALLEGQGHVMTVQQFVEVLEDHPPNQEIVFEAGVWNKYWVPFSFGVVDGKVVVELEKS